MDEDAKLQQVREFLAALSPSEVKRIVELFRMQLGLEPLPPGVQPQLEPQGLPRMRPGAKAARSGK